MPQVLQKSLTTTKLFKAIQFEQEGMQWIRQRGGESNIKFIIFVLQSGHFHNRIKIEKNANYIV